MYSDDELFDVLTPGGEPTERKKRRGDIHRDGDWHASVHIWAARRRLGGMELLAVGTWMYMKSALGSGPRDALMVVLARKTGRSVGLCRATVELIAIFVGWRLGGQLGVGTLISAVGLGILFNLNFGLLHFDAASLHQENIAETLRRLRSLKESESV